MGVHVVEFARFNERGDDCPVSSPFVAAGEESVFAIEGNWPDGSLDDIGVDLDAAVVEEADKPLRVSQPIANVFRISERPGTRASCASSQIFKPSISGFVRVWRCSRRSSAEHPLMSASIL